MGYCPKIYRAERRKTRVVQVGPVGIGGDNPIRIQSMTTSPTHDVDATVDQVMRLADSGCDIARLTVQGKREASACELIKNALLQKGYDIPLVADIHFYPPAAMLVAEYLDKIRINPGNFVDKRASFKVIEYDDITYQNELDRIEEKFTPLVEKCKALRRAMRIGTNHGSLSDRIMNRYGDTPYGMVESALEFARIARKLDYHDFVFSMKASNPLVMIQAYRLLVTQMDRLGWDYPLHLGVTEAGDGEDGRIKSAVGIGALLLDGLGDTIRVSLTEDPWHEIDPCQRLVKVAQEAMGKGIEPFEESFRRVESIERRSIIFPKSIEGGLPLHRDGTVIMPVNLEKDELSHVLDATWKGGKLVRGPRTPDGIFVLDLNAVPQMVKDLDVGVFTPKANVPGTIHVSELSDAHADVVIVRSSEESDWEKLLEHRPTLIFFSPDESRLHVGRKFNEWLQKNALEVPLILKFDYDATLIKASAEVGALLADGIGEGVCLDIAGEDALSISFTLLQAVRMRTTKTEFISCPSCGRTLFNLQEVTARIRARTSHLPGVKIAIMGCIVNGPGEMADADFGYVGSKAGMVDLYVGKECVEKNIDFSEADDRLISLIKRYDRWVEPELTTV